VQEAPVRESRHDGVRRVKRAAEVKKVMRLAQDAVVRARHAWGTAAVRREETIAPPVAGNESAGCQRRVEIDPAVVKRGQREEHGASSGIFYLLTSAIKALKPN